MLQKLVLILAAFPLLAPPGVCLCGSERGVAADVAMHCQHADTQGTACRDAQHTAAGNSCTPHCPANSHTDHSKWTAPRVTSVAAWVVACPAGNSWATARRASAPSLASPPPTPRAAIYLAHCTLVI